MPEITLRPACDADADAMLRVYAPYVTDTTASWEYEPPSRAEFARRLREHLGAGVPWRVAEANGVGLGYASAGPRGGRRGFDWAADPPGY